MKAIEEMKSFYYGKRVLLTGHTGFKGTWMMVMLEELGAVVCGYSLPVNPASFYNKVSPKIAQHIEGDITDSKNIERTVERFKPEIVLHLASHSSLYGSDKIPDYIFKTNVMGVLNIMESIRNNNFIKSAVIVTSDKCYQKREVDVPYVETEPLGAKDPYSTSKVCQELLTSCYTDSFFERDEIGCCVATARASNAIGPGDYNYNRLIPYLLNTFANHGTAKIRNPLAVRPWQNVLDIIYGYLLLGKKLYESYAKTTEFNGAYNFGPSSDGFETVGNIAKRLSEKFVNAEYEIEIGRSPIRDEANVLKLNSDKAKLLLGWQPYIDLERTLSMTADFTIRESGQELTDKLCRDMILEYLKDIL